MVVVAAFRGQSVPQLKNNLSARIRGCTSLVVVAGDEPFFSFISSAGNCRDTGDDTARVQQRVRSGHCVCISQYMILNKVQVTIVS